MRYLFVFFFFTVSINVFPQANAVFRTLENKLIKAGFENIGIVDNDTSLIIAYENRKYRYQVHGIEKAIKILQGNVKTNKDIVLILLQEQIPVICINFPKGQINYSELKVSSGVEAYTKNFTLGSLKNLSNLKLDIVIDPEVRAKFGNFADPIQSQVNVAPELITSLWPGMKFTYKFIIPIQNDEDFFGEEGNKIRPEFMKVSQKFRLPYNLFVSTTGGYFKGHRYGFEIDLRKWFWNGKVSCGANLGRTGYANLTLRQNGYRGLDKTTWFFDVSYRHSRYDIFFNLSYGQYYYEKAVRADLLRQFGEVQIGFFLSYSDYGKNGGVKFSLPLAPKRYFNPGRIRIRPSSYFPWEYKARGLLHSEVDYSYGSAIFKRDTYVHKTEERLWEFLERLTPDFVQKQLLNRNLEK